DVRRLLLRLRRRAARQDLLDDSDPAARFRLVLLIERCEAGGVTDAGRAPVRARPRRWLRWLRYFGGMRVDSRGQPEPLARWTKDQATVRCSRMRVYAP